VALAAVINDGLLRRRHHNAHNTQCPLRHDSQALVDSILQDACAVATALRTRAELREDCIYTHYEGWLPAEEDQPTEQWRSSWCGSGLLRDSWPAATLRFAAPVTAAGVAPHPVYDAGSPAVLARVQARSRPPA